MKNRARLLLALPLLLLGLYLALRPAPRAAEEPAAQAPAAEPAGGADAADLGLFSAGRAAALPPEPERDAAPVEAAEVRPVPALAAPILLSGSLRCVDSNGLQLPDADVELAVVLTRADGGERRETAVRAGRWSLEVEQGTAFDQVRFGPLLRLGRVCAAIDPADSVPFPPAGPIDLVYRVPEALTLHVFCAETGRELSDVWLTRDNSGGFGAGGHPGAEPLQAVIQRGLASPIDATQLDWYPRKQPWNVGHSLPLLAAGPEHAWGRISLPLYDGGSHRIDLERAAELAVDVQGFLTPGLDVRLRLYRKGNDEGPWIDQKLDAAGRQHFRQLPPGPWSVCAEIGSWSQFPEQLAVQSVELSAGAESTVRLELPAQEALVLGRIEGSVRWPPGWDPSSNGNLWLVPLGGSRRGQQGMQMHRLEPQPTAPEGAYAASFSIENLEVGRYHLQVVPSWASFLLDVAALPGPAVRLEVPEPADLLLRFVDTRSGAELRPQTVSWCPTRPAEVDSGMLHNVAYDAQARAYRLQAPSGPIDVFTRLEGYADRQLNRLAVGPGEPREQRIELHPIGELILRLTSAGVNLPIGFELDLRVLRAENREPVPASCNVESHQLRFKLTQPGRYTIVPPSLEGFLAPEERAVEVELGQRVELVYEYRKAP
jgi:hypothetical protein